ncbi:hypothetical protein [Nocardioides marmorisolisilvae]|uniref:Uncharacterized protein n=1 Tax=Nocardioides marmorisolisilvae TaxID=1542737 RepID=A0A3N0DUH6_9ACTN|nr:hypothetical protein [Nocardioides marmorisolisilvae]RNL79053.1 hypothetical protein EFL95_08405 [Nocardioides marmorisolisilvae]
MSEPTRDPIEALTNFGTGGVPVNPLDPAAVRRLGDQRRRRQNTMYGVIAAVVVAAAVIPTALIATKDDGKAAPPTGEVTPTPTPSPTPSTTIVAFPNGGVAIKAPEDTAKLVGTSDDFKTFIKGVWQKDFDSGCKTAEIDVMKYSSAGLGWGGVGGCGGYQAIWALKDGTWREALYTQDEWVCADLERYDVPDGFAGDCYTPAPAPAVVTFPGNGQGVHKESDAALLQGTTDDFKEFIIAEVARLHADAEKTAATDPGACADANNAAVYVSKFAQAGYAVGSVFLCPTGYAAIWKKVDGTWKEVVTTQEQFTCADLDRYDIPHSFIEGDCFDASKQFGPTWAFAFKIGQTTEQVRGVGGTITGDPEGDCATVTKPNVVGSDNDPLKEVAMTRGKVIAIFANDGFYTPEGIGIGSTEDDVKAAYPNGHRDGVDGYWHVPISTGSEYEIGIGQDKKVSELLIQTTGSQRCYG